MKCVEYGCTALMGTNKVGKLNKDENGYYEVLLGALDVYNSGQAWYPATQRATSLFEDSSLLQRRIKDGSLRGEYGHPKRVPGQSMQDYLLRCMTIEETLQAFHIKSVRLDDSVVKGPDGRKVISIVAKILPSGPYGPALEKQLNNPEENVCFSIRALTDDRMVRGETHKELKQIVTWDYVNEPGLWTAKKWHAPTLECYSGDTMIITTDIVTSLATAQEQGKVSMESLVISLENLFESLGYVANDSVYGRPASGSW